MTNEEILKAAIKKADVNLDEEPLVIFTHKFAKKFWGEEQSFESVMVVDYPIKEWQYHLQQMVLEENPIQYLEQFL